MKTFDGLFAELSAKAAERPAGSGTVAALDAGVHAQGKKVLEDVEEPADMRGDNVIDLMAALKRSVGGKDEGGKKKAAAKKPAARKAPAKKAEKAKKRA